MKLSINNLRHVYQTPGLNDNIILKIKSWNVESNSQILLRGISGSGKTTLLNILAGLMTPTQGTVSIDSQSLYALPEAKRDSYRANYIGYIFQTHLLAPHMTAQENVEMPLVFGGQVAAKTRRERATELLRQVGLGNHLRKRPAQLSVGQRLRVAVARALISTPKLLLADEPTASLDDRSSNVVMDLIQTYCESQQAILIIASHDPLLAPRFQRIVDLRDGMLNPAI